MFRKTKSSPVTAAADSDQDAIALLMADHRRVARLFAEFDAVKDQGDDDAKARIVARICQELTIHATIEEEIFYPAARKAIDDEDLMDEAWVEQAGAKNLVAQLKAAQPEDEFYDAKVSVLAEQVDHHVQEEEKDMFPQARASGLDTLALGAKMLALKSELMAASSRKPTPRPATKKSDRSGKISAKKKKKR